MTQMAGVVITQRTFPFPGPPKKGSFPAAPCSCVFTGIHVVHGNGPLRAGIHRVHCRPVGTCGRAPGVKASLLHTMAAVPTSHPKEINSLNLYTVKECTY